MSELWTGCPSLRNTIQDIDSSVSPQAATKIIRHVQFNKDVPKIWILTLIFLKINHLRIFNFFLDNTLFFFFNIIVLF